MKKLSLFKFKQHQVNLHVKNWEYILDTINVDTVSIRLISILKY